MTTDEQKAVDAATASLAAMPTSYPDLIDRLEFLGFTHEEAVYGADHCGAVWSEQARLRAARYRQLLTLSETELIEQLKFDGFPPEQAVYGANASKEYDI